MLLLLLALVALQLFKAICQLAVSQRHLNHGSHFKPPPGYLYFFSQSRSLSLPFAGCVSQRLASVLVHVHVLVLVTIIVIVIVIVSVLVLYLHLHLFTLAEI